MRSIPVVSLQNQRSAFTLVELLVCLAIVGLLVGLFLPAVRTIREPARRIECTNNIRQIALAFQLHHDSLSTG